MAYFVYRTDSEPKGPVSLEMLKKWAADGWITGATILKDTSTGKKISAWEIRELGLEPPADQAVADPPKPSANWASKPISLKLPKLSPLVLRYLGIAIAVALLGYWLWPVSIVGEWNGDITEQATRVLKGAGVSNAKVESATIEITFHDDGTCFVRRFVKVTASFPGGRTETPIFTTTGRGTYTRGWKSGEVKWQWVGAYTGQTAVSTSTEAEMTGKFSIQGGHKMVMADQVDKYEFTLERRD